MELKYNINYKDFKNICRFCLRPDYILQPIFIDETTTNDNEQQKNDGDNIVHMILSCIGLEIKLTDGLPNLICTECLHKLSISNAFRTQCLLSSSYLTTIKMNHENNKEYSAPPEPPSQYNFKSTATDRNELKIDTDNMDDSNGTVNFNELIKNNNYLSDCGDKDVVVKKEEHIVQEEEVCDKGKKKETVVKKKCKTVKKVKNEKVVINDENNKTATVKPKRKRKRYYKKPQPPVICPICGVMQSSLSRHMVTHTGERKYKCNECDKSFTQVDSLKMHKNIHTGEKPYKCDQCTKVFSNCNTLRKHKTVHTGERKYKCHLCVKSFRYGNNLTQHVRGHTEDRRYKCDQCSKMFLTKGVLNKHYLTHTGVRAFKCELCPKAFQTKWHLTVHGKVHGGSGGGRGRKRGNDNHETSGNVQL